MHYIRLEVCHTTWALEYLVTQVIIVLFFFFKLVVLFWTGFLYETQPALEFTVYSRLVTSCLGLLSTAIIGEHNQPGVWIKMTSYSSLQCGDSYHMKLPFWQPRTDKLSLSPH